MTIDAEVIGQFLATVPPWVYPLLLMLLLIAIQASKPIVVPVKRLLYMPTIFISLSFIVIYHLITLNTINIVAWIIALLAGMVMGWYQLRALRIKGITNTKSIYVPGTWSLLIIVLFLVALKFYARYKFAYIDPALLKNPTYAPWFMALYGILTGLFIGRVGHAFHRVKYGPFIEYDAIIKPKPAP